MFRFFMLTAIVLAMTLPAAAQRRDACTVAEDPYAKDSNGQAQVVMVLHYYLPAGGIVSNYLLPERGGQYSWSEDVMYGLVVLTEPGEEGIIVSEPIRPLQSFWTFRNLWTDEIRPELCNLERMELIPARSSILGGN